MNEIKKSITLSLLGALLGEIYPDIIAVAYRYDTASRDLYVRFYLDREATEDDFENVRVVTTEVVSDFHYNQFNKIVEECEFGNLENLR
ncbi:MAG: hypothetical protein ACK5P1_03395, partial [Sphingobacteriia bacterium]